MDSTTATSLHSIFRSVVQSFNTLLDCPVQFSGEYNKQKVHNFVEYIECYKRIKCITDEQALQELQHLLIDDSYIWWIQRKFHLTTWAEALTSLENQYSKQRPAAMIHTELCSNTSSLSSESLMVNESRNNDELHAVSNTQTLFQESYKERYNVADNVTFSTLNYNIGTPVTESYDAEGVPKSAFDQLIVMIKEGEPSSKRKKKVKFVRDLPDGGCYRVILRPSGRHTIRRIPDGKTDGEKINEDKSCNEEQSQIQLNLTAEENNVQNNDIFNTNEREATIKVRRTEDLMPRIKAEEEEFILDNVKTTANDLQNSEENFQIDSELMSQINTIINESEMNMQTLDSDQHFSPTISGLPGTSSTVASQDDTVTNTQSETITKQSIESQSKIHATIKDKKHCSFCRLKGHHYDTCLKRTKQNKLLPDHAKKAEFLSEMGINCSISNNDDNDKPTVTNISSILNNIPEKCMKSILTTKRIDSHSGFSSNKIDGGTIRNTTNNPMPKCHQCGTVGFYKSICPNCSPIYNNQNKPW